MADICYNPDELSHYGIKGMKWGVRRFQKKDGSLTNAGKKRYLEDGDGQTSDKPTKQTRHDKLFSQYKTLGYSDSEAERLAKGRLKTERTLAIIGGVTIAAVVTYAAYRYYDVNVDRYIGPNKAIQTVHTGEVADRIKAGNPFYATYTKRDNTIYASKVFSHFTDQSNVTRMYTKEGIKVASEKTGRKIFDELVKTNPDVKEYSARIGHYGNGRKAYERFNYSLVLRNDSETAKEMGMDGLDHDRIHKIFYDELKKRGYGAVIDVNDSRKEGFTYNPVIVFDDQIKHVISTSKASAAELSGSRTAKAVMWATARDELLHPIKPQRVPWLVAGGATYVQSIGLATKTNKSVRAQTDFVNQYLMDHPGTTLSRKQIAKMYKQKTTT